MNSIIKNGCLFAGLIWFGITISHKATAQAKTINKVNYAAKVNTLIGTKGKGAKADEGYLEAGFTFPGATYPFGMVQFTPTFFAPNKGFVVNQLSGAGCPNMGNFPTLPVSGNLNASPNNMKNLNARITTKKAMAGYYKASVNGNINCDITVTKRTGLARFSFTQGEKKGTVIIGSGANATSVTNTSIKITGPNTCEGEADGGNFCGIAANYKIYFVARFNNQSVASGTWEGTDLKPSASSAQGPNSGAYFTFDVSKNKSVEYQFAISYVSLKNAYQNLNADGTKGDFEKAKNETISAWNKYLGKIEATGASTDRTVQFYTHLYHSLIHPSLSSDVNGDYIGGDHVVHKATGYDNYTGLSNWDTYRTQIQLMAMLAPKQASDVITSTIKFAEQSGGGLPRWVMADVETGIMQGDPTSIVIANAYAFGAKKFDTRAALAVMRRGAEIPGTKSQNELTRPHLEQYLAKGYMQASMELEYTSADFAIGQFALQATGDEELYHRYLKQSQAWKNLYNPKTNWLQSRNADGSWKKFDEDWREATYKNYFWMVPYNIKGLAAIIGGNKVAEERLDDFFKKLNASYGQEWYAAGNEPDFQVPWTYNWIGTPSKTQALVKRIMNEQFTNRDNGLPGNDDLGAMGAWYVFANIGLYPMLPGIGGFTINSPSFQLIKLHLSTGKTLVIKGGSQALLYIKSAKLNGKPLNGTWLTLPQINNGGILQYSLSPRPDQQWGNQIQPPSFN